MRAIFISAIALAAVTGSALAADLPSRRASPVFVPAPVFSWTGFYIGGQVGYGFGRDSAAIDARAIGAPALFAYGGSSSGVVGGGHVGYNYALGNNAILGASGLVVGLEGDVDGSDTRANGDLGVALGTPAGLLTGRVKTDIQGSARGRLGIAVDRLLVYATGGAAFGDFNSSYTLNLPPIAAGSLYFDHVRVGYTVGGGVEYAVTRNWSLRAEYRYSDFGTFTDSTATIPGVVARHHEFLQRAQVGFSYKFDNPVAPVVARY